MIIVPERRAVVLKSRHPDRILAAIPTAKKIEHKGTALVVVPHRIDETKVLNNLLGKEKVKSPILSYYDWPGPEAPFRAQRETSALLVQNPRAYVLNGMGTGKTRASLWAFDYLKKRGKVESMLVVSPLSSLTATWATEIFCGFPHLSFQVVHGDRKKRMAALSTPADIYIINYDGLPIVADTLRKREDIGLIVFDELSTLRNASAQLWKTANVISNKQVTRRVWGMTGTPTPKAPTDAWAQCRLVTPETVPRYFSKFRDMTMRQVSTFVWTPRDDANETVFKAMQPAVRFSLEDCQDMPERVFIDRHVELTAAQSKAYAQMAQTLRAQVESGELQAINRAVMAARLVQIATGVGYGPNGEEVIIGAEPRVSVVKDLVEASASKSLVFAPYKIAVYHVADALRKAGIHTECITGETSKSERDRIINGFQRGGGADVLVASPGCMSHSLTLTAASTIVWYAPITSNETFEQANCRTHRPGQKHNTVIALISGTPIERLFYARLKRQQNMQDALLEMFAKGA